MKDTLNQTYQLSKEEIEMITGFDKIDDNHLDTN